MFKVAERQMCPVGSVDLQYRKCQRLYIVTFEQRNYGFNFTIKGC